MSRLNCRMVTIGLLGTALWGASVLHAQRPVADMILSNGKIITVDDRFSIAQAVAIRGDRIVAVGSNQEIAQLAGPDTKKIDLRGKAVIPGLIDNHMHLLRGGTTWQYEVRLDGVASRKQALEMLAARAKAVGPGEWVYTLGGFAREQFADDPKPFTREELDKAFPNNPVALQESYYRMSVNTKAMQAMGIDDKSTGDVGQGNIGRVAAKLPTVSKENIETSSLNMLKDMNRWGLTTFGVPGCDRDLVTMYRKWEEQGHLNVRVFCIDGVGANTPEQVDRALPQIAQMKLFQGDNYIDNVFFGEGRYGPLHDPMFAAQIESEARAAGAVAQDGDGDCEGRLAAARPRGADDTIDAFLDQIEAVNKEYPIKNLRWTLAHINQINASQLERMKKLGMYAAVHPWAVINGGIMHDDLRRRRVRHAAARRRFKTAASCGASAPTAPRPIRSLPFTRCISPSPARWRAARR